MTSTVSPAPESTAQVPEESPAPDPQSRRKRILYLDHTAAMGGGEIAIYNVIRYLDRSRYHPIACLFAEGPLADQLRAAGVETHVLSLDRSVSTVKKDSLGLRSLLHLGTTLKTLGFIWTIARFIRETKPDLVHTNSLKADIIGGLAARIARVPVVWHVRDRITPEYLPRRVVQIFRLLCGLIPNYVVANSEATLNTIELPRRLRAAAIYSGIDLQNSIHVVHDGTPISDAGEPRSVPERPRLIGLVGRISPWKGQHIFLKAAAEVHWRFPDVRFQIVGAALFSEHAYEQEIRELCTSLKLDGVVEFTGFRKDVSNVVRNFDVLVHASTIGEPFGQVVIEGMAAAKAVIATDGGGVPEIVLDGVTGLLVPMDDAPAMAQAMIRLIEESNFAKQMGRLARERAVERFGIERTVAHVEGLYEEVVQGGWKAVVPSVFGTSFIQLATLSGQCVVAVVAVILAMLLKFGLGRLLGTNSAFSTYYLANLLVVWRLGPVPSMLAILLSVLLIDRFSLPGAGFSVTTAGAVQLLLFVCTCTALTWIITVLKLQYRRSERSRSATEEARRRSTFLGMAFQSFSMLSNETAIAENLAYVSTRSFAEWCVVEFSNGGNRLACAAVTHRDPAKNTALQELHQRKPAREVDVSRIRPLLRINPQHAPQDAAFADGLHAGSIALVGASSLISVPLMARGKTVGVATFVRARIDQQFFTVDLDVASELAWRAAQCITRAGLGHQVAPSI
jgi:glycosyltransferase involved in cell wall biosynthesis